MKASIPRIRESIKEASMRELNDFLESIRKYSPKIGELAMRHAAEKLNVDPTFYGPRTKKQQVWKAHLAASYIVNKNNSSNS